MWNIVMRKHDGQYIRETVDYKPDMADLRRYENFHACETGEGNAVIINVFEVDNESSYWRAR